MVPELPQSSGACGSFRPCSPTPSTPPAVTWTPSARRQEAVLATSSPVARFSIRAEPAATALRISARCEIDLSPGTATEPRSWAGGRMVASTAC